MIFGCFQVEGTLCGFDPFMNLVLDDATEFNKDGTPKGKIGTDRNGIEVPGTKTGELLQVRLW